MRIKVTIISLDPLGRGVGYYKGKVVIVEGAYVGETVECEVVRETATVIYAKRV